MKICIAILAVFFLARCGDAQQRNTWHPQTAALQLELLHQGIAPVLPDIPFGLKELIDVLAEYTVVEETNQAFCRQFYGLTDFDTKTINICARYDLWQRRRTVLHEVYHVLYRQIGIDTGGDYEITIDLKAQELALKLYGLPVLPHIDPPVTTEPLPAAPKVP